MKHISNFLNTCLVMGYIGIALQTNLSAESIITSLLYCAFYKTVNYALLKCVILKFICYGDCCINQSIRLNNIVESGKDMGNQQYLSSKLYRYSSPSLQNQLVNVHVLLNLGLPLTFTFVKIIPFLFDQYFIYNDMSFWFRFLT